MSNFTGAVTTDDIDYVTIFGYGSLMCPDSSRSTMSDAINFRRGALVGYQREFSLVSISGIRSGVADQDTLEIAALSVRPVNNVDCKAIQNSDKCTPSSSGRVLGVLFDIPSTQLLPYLEREHRYQVLQVEVHDWGDGAAAEEKEELVQSAEDDKVQCQNTKLVHAWTVVSQTDEHYKIKCGSPEEYHQRAGQYYSGTQQSHLHEIYQAI